MSSFFLLCQNLGSVLGLLQGLAWLKSQGHTTHDVGPQLDKIKAAVETKNPALLDSIFNGPAGNN